MFEYLGRKYPGRFQEGQLRSLQRRFKQWRARSGPEREVMFPQVHDPGRQCQSDFTHMSSLNVTIEGQKFEHLAYHFRPDLFELGDGDAVFLRILRELIGRTAERVVAVGWSAGRTSDRQPVGGSQQPEGSG